VVEAGFLRSDKKKTGVTGLFYYLNGIIRPGSSATTSMQKRYISLKNGCQLFFYFILLECKQDEMSALSLLKWLPRDNHLHDALRLVLATSLVRNVSLSDGSGKTPLPGGRGHEACFLVAGGLKLIFDSLRQLGYFHSN
jgi:hypothetical protein